MGNKVIQHIPGIFANSLVIIVIQCLFCKTLDVFLRYDTYWHVPLSCSLSIGWQNNKTPPDYAMGHTGNKHHKPVNQNLQIIYWHTLPQRMNEWRKEGRKEGTNERTNEQTNKRTDGRTNEHTNKRMNEHTQLWRSLNNASTLSVRVSFSYLRKKKKSDRKNLETFFKLISFLSNLVSRIVRTIGFRFRIHVYMIILIWCYLFVVVVGKWGVSCTLPTYEVFSQRNVTMFTGCDFLCLYM